MIKKNYNLKFFMKQLECKYKETNKDKQEEEMKRRKKCRKEMRITRESTTEKISNWVCEHFLKIANGSLLMCKEQNCLAYIHNVAIKTFIFFLTLKSLPIIFVVLEVTFVPPASLAFTIVLLFTKETMSAKFQNGIAIDGSKLV